MNETEVLIKDILYYKLFDLGGTTVTPLSILLFITVIVIFTIMANILARKILKRILTRFDIPGGTQFTMIRISQYLIILIGVMVAFQFVGISLSGLTVVFGLLSVGIGFGLQSIAANFIAGLTLIFERPIQPGDRITVGDTEGDVVAINMRATMINTLNNITIIVPNSQFVSSNVINWSHGDPRIRLEIEVGVSYASDLDKVLRVLTEVAKEHKKIIKNPAPSVLLKSFGDSSWNMVMRAWIDNVRDHPEVRSDLNCAIVRKFRENKIEIPFPQRDFHLRSPLPLPLSSKSSSEN